MPLDLFLVRHGESEGNVVFERVKRGDPGGYTPEFRARHGSMWRLTERGRDQARAAGQWLRASSPGAFDRHYVSPYIRALETAGLLGLEGAAWYQELHLREREWGDLDGLSPAERQARFAESLALKRSQPMFWRPPNGESIADLAGTRVARMLGTLHRECSEMRCVIVCHGEVMWAFRLCLERLSQRRYAELDLSKDRLDQIHNGQVLHYTRRDPATGEVTRRYDWMWSVCPWDLMRSRNGWQRIVRQSFAEVDAVPQLGVQWG
jgi:NAD+ kinase